MSYFEKIKLWDDEYCEKHVWNLGNNIKHLLQSKGISELYYIDIGANVGKVYDLLNNGYTVKKVWMYEASPLLFGYLTTKYYGNPSVYLKHVAISNLKGTVNFDESSMIYQINNNIQELNFGLSKISNSLEQPIVECDKLSNLIIDNEEILNNVSFIKIDTENVDFLILDDLTTIIDKFKVKPIIEFEVNYQSSKEEAQEILNKFIPLGYQELKLENCWGDGILIPN